MISLPLEIMHMIKTIEDAGYEAYAVGGCVRDSLLGRQPEDWDLTSNASRDALGALFPEAAEINRKLGVIRITEGNVTADLAAFRIDGTYQDYRRPETVIFTGDLMEDLKRRDFTMNAIAVNPIRGVIDPYNGILDIENKVIRGIGEPRVRFEEDALRILRGIRFSAQLDFQIEENTLGAMEETAELLEYISAERIGEELFKIVVSQNCGRGMRALLKTRTMGFVLGLGSKNDFLKEELRNLQLAADGIDRTPCLLDLRLPILYLCLKREKALTAIDGLRYSNEMKKLLRQAVCGLAGFERIRDRLELKRFVGRFGIEGFRYFSDLSMRHHEVLGGASSDFQREHQKRIEIFKEIIDNGEPVSPRDLAVDGTDLKKLGISEGEQIGEILKELLEEVLKNPKINEKDLLLDLASKQKK